VTEIPPLEDELAVEASDHFRRMVESVGVKRFSSCMELSTRQINRMLSGAQPNPVDRLVRCLQSCEADVGDEALSFICQEAGGLFLKDEEPDLDHTTVDAVRECAEAIKAIADGQVTRADERSVREAICALSALLRAVREDRESGGNGPAAPGSDHGAAAVADGTGLTPVVRPKAPAHDGVAQSA
jgi:hypothetical protein